MIHGVAMEGWRMNAIKRVFGVTVDDAPIIGLPAVRVDESDFMYPEKLLNNLHVSLTQQFAEKRAAVNAILESRDESEMFDRLGKLKQH